MTVYFISTETLDDVQSFTVLSGNEIRYQRGLFFQRRGVGIIRILDVASGTHVNDANLPIEKRDEPHVSMMGGWASCNSKVIAVGWQFRNPKTLRVLSCLRVYDREAVEKKRRNKQVEFHSTLCLSDTMCATFREMKKDWP